MKEKSNKKGLTAFLCLTVHKARVRGILKPIQAQLIPCTL